MAKKSKHTYKITRMRLAALTALLCVIVASAILISQAAVKNTPEQNAEINKQAIRERNHEKCEHIKGSTQTGNPSNLDKPFTASEDDAKKRCHIIIDWWNERDQQNKESR